jgi:glutaminyl-peptide cyclotransferase
MLSVMTQATPAGQLMKPRTTSIGWFWPLLLGGAGLALIGMGLWNNGSLAWLQRPVKSRLTLDDIPVNGERAYGYLKEICAIGQRVSGTEGMQKQQALLTAHFQRLGGRVSRQTFEVRHPLDGSRVPMANLIVEWHPDKKERILLCCHYDTRPFPDEDPINPRGLFIGANDGASGAALLMELAHDMAELDCRYGVDFVLFDGEELVYDAQNDKYFLGSEHFAQQYVANKPAHRYKWGVLVDMIGDAQLQVFQEINSMRSVPTRQLVGEIWGVARDLGVKEFIAVRRYEVRDDHLALNNIARIPTIDIIDFEYPTARGENYWHTTKDVPENCSALSLAKVGWVIRTWLERVK